MHCRLSLTILNPIVDNNLHADCDLGVRLGDPHITKHAFAWTKPVQHPVCALFSVAKVRYVLSLLAKSPFGETNISVSFPDHEWLWGYFCRNMFISDPELGGGGARQRIYY